MPGRYTELVDVWAFGVLMYLLMYGHPLSWRILFSPIFPRASVTPFKEPTLTMARIPKRS